MCLGRDPQDCVCDEIGDVDDVCADCGATVHLSNGRPVDGIVIWGNPSEVICDACAERLEAAAQQAEEAAREADRVALEERHYHDD